MMGLLAVARSWQRPSPSRAIHMFERDVIFYRRSWIIIFSGFFEPLFYLLGVGFGVGGLVGSISQGGHRFSYAVFVAPALMATSAMNGAIAETAFNFFGKLKYIKLYDAVLSTPLGVADVALGEVSWAISRGAIYAVAFTVIMAALHLIVSPWGILALPAALLVGFAFAATGTAVATFVRSWQDFDVVLTVMLPLFLFSATFYPITLYPGWLQVLVQLTPLYHGVDLLRSLTTGALGPWLLVDIAYLVVMAAIGLTIAANRLQRLLLT
jgi:lipooligosaccharide transport system permease protein